VLFTAYLFLLYTITNRQNDLIAFYTIMLGRLYLVILYTVVLGQDDLHFVAFLLDSSPQCSDYIPHASHLERQAMSAFQQQLERQHKLCLPFNNRGQANICREMA